MTSQEKSQSVDFMMLSLGNIVAVPKIPQQVIAHCPSAHSLKIIGHYSDVPIDSQKQSRDYYNFNKLITVPLFQ